MIQRGGKESVEVMKGVKCRSIKGIEDRENRD